MLEILLAAQIEQDDLPEPVREYRFYNRRRWRWDFAWPEHLIAVDVQGGTWTRGAHSRGEGHRNDCEKLCEAVLMGWRVLLFTGDMVNDGSALQYLRDAFKRLV
jgi:hypothetical protein